MKKHILHFLMSLLLFIAADERVQARCAQDFWCYEDDCCVGGANFYGKFLAGANFLQNTSINGNKATYQTGYLVGGSLGYCWCQGFRLEGEYAYRRNAIRKIDFFIDESSKHGYFRTSSCMANLFWDLPLSSWGCAFCNIQPYIGAGIGYDFQKMHASNSRIIFNQRWNHFSWQLMTGFAFPIFCNTELTLEYRFHQGGCHFNNHFIGLGFVYKFGF